MEYKIVDSLKDTVQLMLSKNPNDRLVAEYLQARIRLKEVNAEITKLNQQFRPKPPSRAMLIDYQTLEWHCSELKILVHVLEVRLEREHIHVETND